MYYLDDVSQCEWVVNLVLLGVTWIIQVGVMYKEPGISCIFGAPERLAP